MSAHSGGIDRKERSSPQPWFGHDDPGGRRVLNDLLSTRTAESRLRNGEHPARGGRRRGDDHAGEVVRTILVVDVCIRRGWTHARGSSSLRREWDESGRPVRREPASRTRSHDA
ncbi:hypothetical protein [Pseudonocardia sp. HH130629-09]|uniref:hypothetical protein n=1 Tax=Pseudonocardia sp. HH130629-09 TaxID=1641402 RepID=UPI0011AE658B|nr:hypothetical protein [Pseudonocardia sp. HH130629-09]